MKQAIFYVLGIIGKIVFVLFSIAVIIQVLVADIYFVFAIYQNQFSLAALAMCTSYILAGILTYWFYYIDKKAARRGTRRTPEIRLHQLELIGGWLGAFAAQKLLRHKSIKSNYQMVYWLISFFHLSLFLLFIPVFFPQFVFKKYVVMFNLFLLFVAYSAIGKKE